MFVTVSSAFIQPFLTTRRAAADYRRAMTRTHRFAAILTLLLIITPALAAAQTSTPVPSPPEKKWSLVRGFSLGDNVSAPAFENAMRAAGFDDTSPGFFSGGVAHPFSGSVSSGSMTDVTYRHSRRLALGLRRTSADVGITSGYQADFKWLYLGSKVSTFAPIAYFRVNSALRVGAGPVAAATNVSTSPSPSSSSGEQSFKSTVYGGLITASLETGIGRYFTLGFNISRLWIPDVAVGPFTSDSGDSLNERYGTATLPAMRVNLSHQTFGLSLGIRF